MEGSVLGWDASPGWPSPAARTRPVDSWRTPPEVADVAAARREARGGPSDVAVSLFDQLPDLGTRRSWTTRTGARLKNFGMLGAGLLIAVLLAIHGSPPRADDAADDDDMHTIPTPRGANSSGDSSR